MIKSFLPTLKGYLTATHSQTAPSSQLLASLRRLAEIYPLTELLPYLAYDEAQDLYLNQRSIGFVLQIAPFIGADRALSDAFNRIIADNLSPGTYVQCLTWASPKIASYLHPWQQARTSIPLFSELAKARVDHISRGTLHSLTGAMPMIARHFQCFVVVSQARTSESSQTTHLIRLRDILISYFNNHGGLAKPCLPHHLLSVVSDWLYPNRSIIPALKYWNQHQALSDQLSKTGGLHQVHKDCLGVTSDDETWAIQSLTVDEYPSHWALWGMADLIGDCFNPLQQIPCPFLFSHTFYIHDKKQSARANIKSDRTIQLAQSKIGKWLPLIGETYQDWEYTKQRLAKQDCLVDSLFQVVLFTPEHACESARSQVISLFQAKSWRLSHEPYLQLPCFLHALPMLCAEGLHHDLKRWRRFKTLPSEALSQLVPLFGEPPGSQSGLLLLSRRGQCFFWDNFDAANENYNVCVIAASGAGKSVLINEKIMTQLSSGGRIWIIDVGFSYQKLCQYLQGNYLEFSSDKCPVINPFTHIQDIHESLSTLKPLISLMARPKTCTSEEEDSFIEAALLQVWADYGNDSDLTKVSHYLKSLPDERAQNLAHLLRSYTHDGAYAKFFSGRASIDLDNPFMVLELEALKRKKDLQAVVLWSMMQHMTEVMFLSDRAQKKEIIIDEAWELLKSENRSARDFIESISRRARKYMGGLITITQGFNEYYNNPAASAAWQNSATKVLLAQTREAIDEAKSKQQGIHLDPFRERLLKSVQRTEYYSELVIVDNRGFRLGRLILDPLSLILYSSKGVHVEAVNCLLQQGVAINQAVRLVADLKTRYGDRDLLQQVRSALTKNKA